MQGLNDFNDVTFAFDDIDDDNDEGLNGIIDVTFAFNDNDDDVGSNDFRVQKLYLGKFPRYIRENNMFSKSTWRC